MVELQPQTSAKGVDRKGKDEQNLRGGFLVSGLRRRDHRIGIMCARPPGQLYDHDHEYYNTSTMSCGFCHAGRYSDQPNATACTTCPTSRTSVPGSSWADACCAGSTAVFLGPEVTVSGTVDDEHHNTLTVCLTSPGLEW